MMPNTACPICNCPEATAEALNNDSDKFNCPICGNYDASRSFLASVKRFVPWKLSAAIRMRSEKGQDVVINSTNWEELIDNTYFPTNPIDIVDNLLLYLYKRHPDIGKMIPLLARNTYSALGISSPEQLHKITQYARELNYLTFPNNQDVEITLNGWEHIHNLQQESDDSDLVFVAMWFDLSMKPVFDLGIIPAVEACGFTAERVDIRHFNSDIYDEIVMLIKRCRFAIADLTGNRAGVYYEAGYAHGLGKALILTCKRSDFEDKDIGVHFDLSHQNIILWDTPKDLSNKLENRIRATIL